MWCKTFSAVMLGALCLTGACQNVKLRMNEDKAKLSMKSLKVAEAAFKTKKGKYGGLEELAASGLIDSTLASGVKDGYQFQIRVKGDSYESVAMPVKYGYVEGGTGSWSFYLNESGVVRGDVKSGTEATVNDPPLRYQ